MQRVYNVIAEGCAVPNNGSGYYPVSLITKKNGKINQGITIITFHLFRFNDAGADQSDLDCQNTHVFDV